MPKSQQLSRCASCNARLQPAANFCPNCGAPVGGRPAGRQWGWKEVALVVFVAAAVSFGATFLAGRFATDTAGSGRQAPANVATPEQRAGRPPDLSTMTPREAADRLFNRVMAADERGDSAEAMRFAPMAIMAYQRVDRLDADARYHVGLLNLVAGNLDGARKQAAELDRESPSHLLGLALSISLAEKAGDQEAASAARGRFVAAYEKEIMSGRPEYQAHQATLVKIRAAAMESGSAKPPARISTAAQAGARVFAAKCAECHGPAASGSDKGPPLVHKIYEPGHHGDGSFLRAVRQGVRQHHWPFGNMPPVPGVTDEQVRQIVAYVRGLQEQAGIR